MGPKPQPFGPSGSCARATGTNLQIGRLLVWPLVAGLKSCGTDCFRGLDADESGADDRCDGVDRGRALPRSAASVKVVVNTARAAGASNAANMPWSARAVTSIANDCAIPPMTDAQERP